MCAIKHINFEFVFSDRHFATHTHAQLRSERIVYRQPVDCWCRWQSNPPQIQSLSLSHVSIHGNMRTVDTLSSPASSSSETHIILEIHQNSMHSVAALTPMWQNVTFPWTFCECGLKCGKMLNMIWDGWCVWLCAHVCHIGANNDCIFGVLSSLYPSRSSNEIKW